MEKSSAKYFSLLSGLIVNNAELSWTGQGSCGLTHYCFCSLTQWLSKHFTMQIFTYWWHSALGRAHHTEVALCHLLHRDRFPQCTQWTSICRFTFPECPGEYNQKASTKMAWVSLKCWVDIYGYRVHICWMPGSKHTLLYINSMYHTHIGCICMMCI